MDDSCGSRDLNVQYRKVFHEIDNKKSGLVKVEVTLTMTSGIFRVLCVSFLHFSFH